ncbi:MAG: Uncharacterised protein [Pseudidiomarina mangrovi]|nr:MAG: Uncharacterised protein [Pseudidiomarina mangrovi]
MKPHAWLCACHNAECLLAYEWVIAVKQARCLVAIVGVSKQVGLGYDVVIFTGTSCVVSEQSRRYIDVLPVIAILRESPRTGRRQVIESEQLILTGWQSSQSNHAA